MSENRYLSGNFGPVEKEVTATDLEVTGEIPAELAGRLLRIGPNPVAPDPENYHWFIGNGMAHGIRLRDGKAEWYRNRYVRDDTVAEKKGWPQTPRPDGREAGGAANTNIIGINGKTFAVVEAGGLPVELTDDLETVAYSDFGGTLPAGFTAHPKRDPETGELHAAVYSFMWEHIQYVVVGADGRVRKTVDVPTPGSPMVHDCGLTENYFILLDLPVVFKPEPMALPYAWDEDYGARIGLLPREGSAADVIWCEVDPCYVFHPMNSYEDSDGRVVLDVIRHPKMFATDMQGPNEGAPTFERWLVDPKGGPVKRTLLHDQGQEFPRHDERLVGKPYRYGYTAGFAADLEMGGLLKHDLRNGKVEHHSEGKARRFLEPVFVPRNDTADEDDGWVLAYVYDESSDKGDVVILHAQDFTAPPIATVHLPQRVPFGFHGNWLPE
jgi:carotenoid cleavage dioxygenase-like enzyme